MADNVTRLLERYLGEALDLDEDGVERSADAHAARMVDEVVDDYDELLDLDNLDYSNSRAVNQQVNDAFQRVTEQLNGPAEDFGGLFDIDPDLFELLNDFQSIYNQWVDRVMHTFMQLMDAHVDANLPEHARGKFVRAKNPVEGMILDLAQQIIESFESDDDDDDDDNGMDDLMRRLMGPDGPFGR
jgi:hypothetical protein